MVKRHNGKLKHAPPHSDVSVSKPLGRLSGPVVVSSPTRTTVPKRPCGKPLLACRQEVTDSRTEQPSHRQFSSEVAPRAYFRALPWTWVPTGDDASSPWGGDTS